MSYCTECRGSGYRRVVLPSTIRSYLAGGRGFVYTGSIACKCRLPKDGSSFNPRAFYDPKRFCLAESLKPDELKAALLTWLDSYQRGEEQDAMSFQPMNGGDYATSCAHKGGER